MAAIANFIQSLVLPSTIASPSASVPAVSMTSPFRCSPSPNFPHKKGLAPLVLSMTARDGDRDISWVVNPSLAHATTLFFKSSHYNVQITVDDNESEERLLNRFRREVIRAGIIRECKRRRFFETSQEYHKRKTREAARKRSWLGDTARLWLLLRYFFSIAFEKSLVDR